MKENNAFQRVGVVKHSERDGVNESTRRAHQKRVFSAGSFEVRTV